MSCSQSKDAMLVAACEGRDNDKRSREARIGAAGTAMVEGNDLP